MAETLEYDPDANRTPPSARGCKALVAAVMLQAVQDAERAGAVYRLLTSRSRGRPKQATILASIRDGLDVEGWAESDEMNPYSFLWCCDVLDMDPQRIRDRMMLGEQVRERLVEHYQLISKSTYNIPPLRMAA